MKSDGTVEPVLGVWGLGLCAVLLLYLLRPCRMSSAALHRRWPLGHVAEEEAHVAVTLLLGPRCRLREGQGQVPMSCSVVGVVVANSVLVWECAAGMFCRSACSSPSVGYIVYPGVEF